MTQDLMTKAREEAVEEAMRIRNRFHGSQRDMVIAILADEIEKIERRGVVRGMRMAADEYSAMVITQEIALSIRQEADRIEKDSALPADNKPDTSWALNWPKDDAK